MKKKNQHIINQVAPDSIAEELEIEVGDILLEINGNKIEDIFDYQYYTQDEYIEAIIDIFAFPLCLLQYITASQLLSI